MSEEQSYVKEIITDESKLREVCRALDYKKDGAELRETILALKKTMEANNLVILSAPQIGIYNRVFCIKDKNEYKTFLDPFVEKATQFAFSRESDECFPEKEYLYPRNARIVLDYIETKTGGYEKVELAGFNAFAVQRMINHFDGILNSDIGLEIDEQWDQATEDERAEVLKAYADALAKAGEKANAEIEQDETLSKQMKAIEFVHGVTTGEVQIEQREVTDEEKQKIEEKLKESNPEE